MKEWRFWLAEQRGTLLALGIFVRDVHASTWSTIRRSRSQGFTATAVANVSNTAANKAMLLALVAMAQTLVVITAGIDLSVGMIFTLTNCIASWLVVGSPTQTAFGVVVVLLVGALCGAINGAIVIFGRLQPIVATIATGAIYFGVALHSAALPRRLRQRAPGGFLHRPILRRHPGEHGHAPRHRARHLAAVQPFGGGPRRLRGRLLGGRRLHVWRSGSPREVRRLYAVRACSLRSAGST